MRIGVRGAVLLNAAALTRDVCARLRCFLCRAHRELQQRRERAAKLQALTQDMAAAKAAMGKGTKRKLAPGEAGAPQQYKFRTERKK